MNITIFYNDAKVREFTDISMVYDNLHANTYDLHYRIYEDDYTNTCERMHAISKEGVARLHIRG